MELQDGLPPKQRVRALLTLGIAIGVSVLGSALPDIALPMIATDLRVTPAESVWVINAYQIAVTISLLPCSSLGDIYGYRRVYGWGLALFTVAVLACAFATSLPALTAARVVQGFGAAGIMSVNTALVRYIFPRALLGRGLGINALIVGSSSALGPSLAAMILSFGSWHWLFAANVPLALFALANIRALPLSAQAPHRFDWVSALMNAATFGLLIAALDGMGHGRSIIDVAPLLLATLVVGFVFVRRQLGMKVPMLPVDLFRRPVFALSVAASISSFCAQTLAYVSLPFLFHATLNASPKMIGLLMTPWPLSIALLAPLSGRLSDRFSAGVLGTSGLLTMMSGLLALAFLPDQPAWWNVDWRMALAGAGFALFQPSNNRQLLGAVPRERSGAGSGMLSTSRLLGQTVGAALVAVVFTAYADRGVAYGAQSTVVLAACFCALGASLSAARLGRSGPVN